MHWLHTFYSVLYIMIFLTVFVLVRQPNELWEKCLLMYKEKNQENLILSKMCNMPENFNDREEISHLCLMENEQMGDPNSSDDDDDGKHKLTRRRKRGRGSMRRRAQSSRCGIRWFEQVVLEDT